MKLSRELARLIDTAAQVVVEDESLIAAMASQDYAPADEKVRLVKILERGIEDFVRFYVRQHAETPTDFLTAEQVAARYRLDVHWVYRCKELNAIKVKVGKYCRYPLDKVIEFETRKEKRGGFMPITRRQDIAQARVRMLVAK